MALIPGAQGIRAGRGLKPQIGKLYTFLWKDNYRGLMRVLDWDDSSDVDPLTCLFIFDKPIGIEKMYEGDPTEVFRVSSRQSGAALMTSDTELLTPQGFCKLSLLSEGSTILVNDTVRPRLDTITLVEYLGTKPVYKLRLEKAENFLVNNFIVRT